MGECGDGWLAYLFYLICFRLLTPWERWWMSEERDEAYEAERRGPVELAPGRPTVWPDGQLSVSDPTGCGLGLRTGRGMVGTSGLLSERG